MSETTPTVLIVDDQPKLGALVAEIFYRLEFSDAIVCTAPSEALAALESREGIDLIVSDLDMSPMDGLQFLRTVKCHPKFYSIGFILTETTISYDQVATAHSWGVDAFLLKPFDIPLLKTKLKAVLRRSQSRKRLQFESRSIIGAA